MCSNKAAQVFDMLQTAKNIIKGKSFSLSLRIPKQWMINEESVFDIVLVPSIKDKLNRIIRNELQGFSPKGEYTLIFDFNSMEVFVEPKDMFIFGRYIKQIPGLSQTRWPCSYCKSKGCSKCKGTGKLYESIEEIIGEPFKLRSRARDYVLHASGREDVDATNSAGRPFVLRLKKPEIRSFRLEFVKTKGVDVKDLKVVSQPTIELVTESHFDKGYIAEISFSDNPDFSKLDRLKNKIIEQKTPRRVLARRANLVRKRKIFDIKLISRSNNKAKIYVLAEAGTYIKELISGDGGRTKPNISEILQTNAFCTSLEVCEIKDDFISYVLQA